MPLSPGTRLGPYEIVAPLGAGGMGEVYRAADTNLKRQVAIKVLPQTVGADPERLARFQREAEVLAALNHPNIAHIHGLEKSDGTLALVMELVEGPTLADRIAKEPIPLDEVLPIAKQIAEALEAAHEQGIIHRDLKPANIKVRRDGTVKVLDFGLAKALDPMAPGTGHTAPPDLLNSPTITSPAMMTSAGLILGTAAYMSPEQAKGKPVDKRTDIWAFGCVLYEMLTGQRAFAGEDAQDTLVAVLSREPAMETLPANMPSHVRALIRRCLKRDAKQRLRDIGDARIALDEDPEQLADITSAARHRIRSRWWIAIGVAAGILAGAGVGLWLGRTERAARDLRALRIELPIAENTQTTFKPVVSPDGRRIAYATDSGVWIRHLDRSEPSRRLATLADLRHLFWSSDQQWLGLATGDALWKVPSGGGEPSRIASLARLPGAFNSMAGGAVWLPEDRIVFTTGFTGLLEVSARGGDYKPLLDLPPGVDIHSLSALPDGSLLYAVHAGAAADTLEVWRDGQRKVVHHAAGQSFLNALYSPTGHLIYERADTTIGLWAMPFSIETLSANGDPFMIAPRGLGPSLSSDGAVLVASAEWPRAPARLVLMGRDGRVRQTLGPTPSSPRMVLPTLAPDGTRVSVALPDGDTLGLWVLGIGRDITTRVADDVSLSNAAWWPDGRGLLVQTGSSMCFSGNCFSLTMRSLDGSVKTVQPARGWGATVSPDSRYLLYTAWRDAGEWDLVYRDPVGGETTPFVGGPGFQFAPRFSPTGRYVAYVSRESGREEVYVATFPDGQQKWRVSNDGGYWPAWSKDGARLFFAQGTSIREVAVTTEPTFALGLVVEALPSGTLQPSTLFNWPDGFDVTGDGAAFVLMKPEGERPRPSMTVMQNWLAGIDATR